MRILIADDHGMVRQGMRMYLTLEPDFEIVGEARDGAEALRLALELRPDVVLMDLLMPVVDGVSATRAIRHALPDTQVVAVTSIGNDRSIADVLRAGAIGYVRKDADAEALCRAVRAAGEGEVRLTPDMLEKVMQAIELPARPADLTERETEVLRLVAHGAANKEIARCLGISEKTVKSHVASILDKLNLVSRTQAALFAVRSGLVHADENLEEVR